MTHAREPKNFRRIEQATASATGNNPLCGDKIEVQIVLDDKTVREICFEGSGCAISIASASMMTEMLTGAKQASALQLVDAVTQMLNDDFQQPVTPLLNDQPVAALAAVRQYPSRVKCAALAWRAVEAAVSGQSDVSTESK